MMRSEKKIQDLKKLTKISLGEKKFKKNKNIQIGVYKSITTK